MAEKFGMKLISPVHPPPTLLTGASQTMKLCIRLMFLPPSLRKPPRCESTFCGWYWPWTHESCITQNTVFSSHCRPLCPPWTFDRSTVTFAVPIAGRSTAPAATSESWMVSDHLLELGLSPSSTTLQLILLFLIVTFAARTVKSLQLITLLSMTVLAAVTGFGPVYVVSAIPAGTPVQVGPG